MEYLKSFKNLEILVNSPLEKKIMDVIYLLILNKKDRNVYR